MIWRQHPKVESCSATSSFWNNLEEQWWRENLPVGRTEDTKPGCSVCLGGKMARYVVIEILWLWLMVWLDWSWTWEDHGGNLVTKLGKRYVDRPLWIGKKRKKKNLYPMWILTKRITSVEEDFNNEQDHPLCVYQSASLPSNPCSCQMGSWKCGCDGRDGALCTGSVTCTSIHQGRPGSSWAIDQPATWWQVVYTRLLPSSNGQCFVLSRMDNSFFGTDLPSMHTMLLLELPAVDTHAALLLIKELIP